MPIVNAPDGCPLYYQVEGPADAPALILCNSLGTDLHMWDDQASTWAKHFRLIRYDRRGHGKSGTTKGPYTMDMLGRDALAVADAAGASKFNWVGLSMGGMVGQWLGANAPDRLIRMVISNTNFCYADKEAWNTRIKNALKDGLAPHADPMMKRWFTAGFIEKNPEAIARVVKMFGDTTVDGFVGCCEAIRDMDFRESNTTITTPTLVIVGAKDPATLPEYGEAIHKAIKGSKLVAVDGAHISNIEAPQAYTDAVLEFLTQR